MDLELVGWGDLDGDGVEDVVARVSEQHADAPADASTLILARRKKDGPLEPIGGDAACASGR